MSRDVKYPDVYVPLVGQDGNAFSIMGRVSQAMKRAGYSQAQVNEYMDDAMSGDYDNLLSTTMRYVNVGEQDEYDDYDEDD